MQTNTTSLRTNILFGFQAAIAVGYLLSNYTLESSQTASLWLSIALLATCVFGFINNRTTSISGEAGTADDKSRLEALQANYDKLKQDSTKYQQMVENTPINTMMANKEGKITYLNLASFKTLRSIENILPVKVDDILGGSMDVFHKKPSKQRGIIADPSNLPHQAEIQLEDEYLDLLVSPLYDHENNYLGPMVTWSVITEKINTKKRTLENKERLETTVLEKTNNTEKASSNLMTNFSGVTAATQEMISSINEISSNTRNVAEKTKSTVDQTLSAKETMANLKKNSDEITEIVKVVTEIAAQTNLLALNATIEAARAGEAGKGFAVVASEVKELAEQTKNATGKIAEKVGAIQSESNNAMEVITETATSIEDLDKLIVMIASSVEEQNAAVEEIGSNIEVAETSLNVVSRDISDISESVKTNLKLMEV